MTTKAQMERERVLENRRTAFNKKVASLLGHVAGRLDQKALAAAFASVGEGGEYGPVAEAFAAQVASQEPVGRAIHALKADAVVFAETKALETVERVRKELEAAEWNQSAYSPYPKGNRWNNPSHDVEMARHTLVSQLTEADESRGYQRYGTSAPYYVKMDEKGIERFVNHARVDAAFQYDAFICKMVSKVGEVREAVLEGSHVWSHSFLIVTKSDGSTERWKTQQIVNYSVYGRPYLQWPSRKVK